MKTYRVSTTDQTTILFEGAFPSFKDCVETAVTQKVNLGYADLSYKNLTNAQLDNACLPYANFTGSNLTGANLSEAQLFGANFSYASLFNTCFANSDLQHCRFDYAAFGATDFSYGDISFSYFAGKSCFHQDFMHTEAMEKCVFKTLNGNVLECSNPPIVVLGLSANPMVFANSKRSRSYLENKVV